MYANSDGELFWLIEQIAKVHPVLDEMPEHVKDALVKFGLRKE
jgi:hypothetical protein